MTNSVKKLFLADVFGLRILLSITGFLFAFGLWFADSTGGAYNSMLRHAPASVWGLAFFIYSCAKVYLALNDHKRLLAYFTMLLGVYLWLFTLLSFMDNPIRSIGSADLTMFVLVLVEVWVGAANIAEAKK
jgi:hypothetical protein